MENRAAVTLLRPESARISPPDNFRQFPDSERLNFISTDIEMRVVLPGVSQWTAAVGAYEPQAKVSEQPLTILDDSLVL